MKKKFLVLVLAALLAIAAGGCSDNRHKIESHFDDDGNFIIESDSGCTTITDSLPAYIPYTGNSIPLIDVSFYEECVDYSYVLFIVSTLDISSLSDADLHWLRKSDLDVQAYITCEQNGYDFRTATALGSLLVSDEGKLIFVRTSSLSELAENRKSFYGSDINVCFNVRQEETYEYTNSEGKVSNLNKHEKITYTATIEDTVLDLEEMDGTLLKYVSEWIKSR